MRISLLLLLTASLAAYGQAGIDKILGQQQQEFLPVDQAFQFDFEQQGDRLTVSWQIAEGYYLYKKRFAIAADGAKFGEPQFPPAETIEDEYFGVSEVFYQAVSLDYPIKQADAEAQVKIRYQGCADAGLCYPPTTKTLYLDEVTGLANQKGQTGDSPVSSQFELADLLSGDQNLALTLALFVVLGIGLAFTPCVFPMYPILSGIILGQGKVMRSAKAFQLSFIYVQGMAITYSLLGLVVASAGMQFQAALQHPAILITFTTLFVALGLAMFGSWNLQLPASWQAKLSQLSQRQEGGKSWGVFVMGALSGLIASPCTTAPLTGILLFVAQSGDLVLGFSALYALSMGMGIPLILFGLTGGKLLPKAGAWMNVIKVSFGFMMLAVAMIFIERLWDNQWTALGWSILGLTAFSYWQVINQTTTATFWKGVRSLLVFLGLFTSALYGYQQLTQTQLSGGQPDTSTTQASHPVQFVPVENLSDFEHKLKAANADGKSVMLDLYADWCVACKEFEKYTFPDPKVQQRLSNTVLMQIDLTDNSPENIQFQEHFAVLGLPTILFFTAEGQEVTTGRITGFMRAEPFAEHLSQLPLQ
ncbi:Protein-disulfide reductase [Saliniradius amylolyticus]|uniref:Thiol:disulfide interchange protein DsbD n=1 Tax=Saliniradius amylolyticus TaxID=2183582 RepID=A0A2S2E6M9_9ALTE|nr:protein-disulfide reductase DsbD [Saliniradius amylolyticus]AWL13293.1 Protein-disulfide reductase [Saliniradius amylolyticus]